MTDQPFPDRVTQLRRRWEADRTSRLFLQLAEEYRQLGRLRESVEVLDAGLVEHPGYLSALVAKGRCHLELDEPQAAREALERVVRQDATQAVASKLLVRAYIDLGELARARERLSLYALLHETDPDIAELRRRLEAPDLAPPLAAVAISGTHEQPGAEPIGAEVAAPARSDAMNEDIFDLRYPAHPQVAIPPSDDLFGLYRQPEVPEPPKAATERPAGEIFSGLGGGENHRRWAEGLAFGGIFDLRVLDIPPTVSLPPATPSAPRIPEPSPNFAPAPSPAPRLGFEPPPFAIETLGATEPAIEIEPEPRIAPQPEPENETVTLAELYLRQGHRDEALRILGQVLRREPENVAAHDLAARIRGEAAAAAAQPAPEESAFTTRLEPIPAGPAIQAPLSPLSPVAAAEAAESLAPVPAAAAAPSQVVSKTQSKIQLLTAYLERLRRGSAPGVS
ncbi:MAG TPA: tetratricopeptide repeat protein [Thermoanaerobaculia bacterium]|nr:tetratricopeptide repeat protein [Thermoanaerobaculia bacterium]